MAHVGSTGIRDPNPSWFGYLIIQEIGRREYSLLRGFSASRKRVNVLLKDTTYAGPQLHLNNFIATISGHVQRGARDNSAYLNRE